VLKLRRGVVVAEDPLTVEVEGERRKAWADETLVGEVREGDEVVVNVEARDLELGSGGFDVVHVNLTRGLEGTGAEGVHVMKLNYSSLQHPVEPVEGAAGDRFQMPVLVIPLHGHLAPAAWAAAQTGPDLKVGYVQTAGGALPGSLSKDVRLLRDRGLLTGHVTAAPAYGGEGEAMSVAGALDAASAGLGWDAAIAGPGPGIIGSDTRLGHGGMAALDTAHAALTLGLPTLISPRLSGADERPRHRGLSHHSRTVLELLLAGVHVPVPDRDDEIAAEISGLSGQTHRLISLPADLDGYGKSGLPAKVMGRGIADDPLFFEAPLAAGRALGEMRREGAGEPSG
jgi:Protein of unknown function (DUF3866)